MSRSSFVRQVTPLLALLFAGPVAAGSRTTDIGQEGSIVLTAMAPDGHWILRCQVEDGATERIFGLGDQGFLRRDLRNRLVTADGRAVPLRVDLAVARDLAGRYLVVRSGDDLVLYDSIARSQRLLARLPPGDDAPVATFDVHARGLVFDTGRRTAYLDLRTGSAIPLSARHATLDPDGEYVWEWPDERLPGGGPPWGTGPCEAPLAPLDGYTIPTGRPGAWLRSLKTGERLDASNIVTVDRGDPLVRGSDGLIRRQGVPLLPCPARLEHVDPLLLSCGDGEGARLYRFQEGAAVAIEGPWYNRGTDAPLPDRFLLHPPTSDIIDSGTGSRRHLPAFWTVVVATENTVVWWTTGGQMVWTDLLTGESRVDPRRVDAPVPSAGTWAAFPILQGGSVVIDATTGRVTELDGYVLGVTTSGRALLATPGILIPYPPRGPARWVDGGSAP